jgi:hypothetical protein
VTNVRSTKLNLGDYLWLGTEDQPGESFGRAVVLPVIVERKRRDDLWHSVKDGRWREQKVRNTNRPFTVSTSIFLDFFPAQIGNVNLYLHLSHVRQHPVPNIVK